MKRLMKRWMTLLALVFRLGDIQGLPVPMFGDSLHHTIITTIIETTGRVPTGYQPFVPVDTFTYHFGFHTLAAVLAMLTADSAPNAVLIMGQVLNVASLPTAYLLARTLDALHKRLKSLQDEEHTQRKELDSFLAGLTVE